MFISICAAVIVCLSAYYILNDDRQKYMKNDLHDMNADEVDELLKKHSKFTTYPKEEKDADAVDVNEILLKQQVIDEINSTMSLPRTGDVTVNVIAGCVELDEDDNVMEDTTTPIKPVRKITKSCANCANFVAADLVRKRIRVCGNCMNFKPIKLFGSYKKKKQKEQGDEDAGSK